MAEDSIRTRIAGQRAMREVVEAEAAARPRTRLERILGIRALSPAARRSFGTALGDAEVGPVLAQLGQRWDVLHDVPVDASRTIDHLAIGPGGVFAVRAAHCGGADVEIEGEALTIAGARHGDLIELAESAALAHRLLVNANAAVLPSAATATSPSRDDFGVTPLFVMVDAGRVVVRAQPAGVLAVELTQLHRTIEQVRPRLSGDVVASISDLADRPNTWPAVPDDDSDHLHREFQSIRNRVGVALRRRIAWAIAVFAVAAGTTFAAIAAYVSLVVLA